MKKKTLSNGAMKKPVKKPGVRQQFPKGWNQKRVQALIDYYDSLTEDEWVALIESADTAEATPQGQKLCPSPAKKKPARKK